MIVGQALVLDLEAVDHLGDRIEAVKINEIPKHLPAGMRSALATDVYDCKSLFKKFIVHDPLGENRIAVVIEVHLRTPRGKSDNAAAALTCAVGSLIGQARDTGRSDVAVLSGNLGFPCLCRLFRPGNDR